MATLLISLDERLARRLLNLAANQNRSVDELLERLISNAEQEQEMSPSARSLLELARLARELNDHADDPNIAQTFEDQLHHKGQQVDATRAG
ncbi:MAG: hypothetical protein SNJ54_00385 [Anaerolineae bacterium]|jgi:hypothetical protein